MYLILAGVLWIAGEIARGIILYLAGWWGTFQQVIEKARPPPIKGELVVIIQKDKAFDVYRSDGLVESRKGLAREYLATFTGFRAVGRAIIAWK